MNNLINQITNYLWNQSWQILVLVLIIAAVTYLLKNKSAHIKYLLWLIIVAKCICPPLLTVPLPILPQNEKTQQSATQPTQTQNIIITTDSLPAANNYQPPTAIGQKKQSRFERLAEISISTWLVIIWATGVSTFLIIALFKAARTQRWLIRNRQQLPIDLHNYVNDFTKRIPITNKPNTWIIDLIGQPFVWGIFKGSIYLPKSFTSISDSNQQNAILAHELSHVARFDALINLLQIIAQSLFWFHPFVWWANKKIRAEREKCCDEMAIAQTSAEPKVFGSAIVNTLITEHKSAMPVPTLAIAGPVKNIEERIKTIMKPNKKFHKKPGVVAIVSALLIGIFTIPTTLAFTRKANKKPTAQDTLIVKCSGQVSDFNGKPVKNATVYIYKESSDGIAGNVMLEFIYKTETDINGKFTFEQPSEPEKGRYFYNNIVASQEGYALGWANWDVRKGNDVKIELQKPSFIEGQIVNENGQPVSKAEVRACLHRIYSTNDFEWLPGIAPFEALKAITDKNGHFKINNIPEDSRADLLVKANGYATTYTYQFEKEPDISKGTFRAGQKDIKIALPSEGRITGEVINTETGEPAGGVRVAVVATYSPAFFYRFVCVSDKQGRFNIGGLREGKYLIRGKSIERSYANVKPGETTDTKIKIKKRNEKINLSSDYLKRIGLAAIMYADDNDGKLPNDLTRLKPYIEEDDTNVLDWALENVEYLGRGKLLQNETPVALGYDKALIQTDNGTNVLFNDGHVEFVQADRLKEFGIIIPTILIEARILSVPSDNNDINEFLDEIAKTNEQPPDTNSLVLNNQQYEQLIELTQIIPEAKMLASPKVLVLDGQSATIEITTEVPYVCDVDENDLDPNGNPKPIIDYADIGTILNITTELRKNGKILLEFIFEHSELTGYEETTFREKYVYKNPTIYKTAISSKAIVLSGQNLLIKTKPIEDKQLLILIKAERAGGI